MLIYYLLLFALCSSSEIFEEYYPQAEKFLQKMTMEERIGQMFFPRFIKADSSDDIKNRKPGGFVLFAYDFNYDEEYIQNYIKEIQKLSMESVGLPLGLAVDEEGGIVCRVSSYHRKEGRFPSPQEIYKKSGNWGISEIDKEKRDLLRKFYLNVNLAPVADVSYNENDYIYARTLGKQPNETAYYIGKDVEGYVNDKFSCCAKHFPGYGNNIDTHGDIAIDKRSYETFLKEDFLPFQFAIAKKIPMILVSHNIVECKDPKYPSSLSKEWHNILRKDLDYSGLILTDDISMGAIKKYTANESEAVLAILAGNDIILTSDFHEHYDAVIAAYKAGKIDDNLINTACRRIIAWKYKYGLINDITPTPYNLIEKLAKSGLYSTKIRALSGIGKLLIERGYETAFIAGTLANIYHEGSIGKFESSAYHSNPDEKPEYLVYMDEIYDYKRKYSNKLINQVSLKDVGIILEKLKRANWQKGKFGLGCFQWRGERTYNLYKLYQQECGNPYNITIEQATKAEGKMIIKEFDGNYKYVYDQWKKENDNTNTPIAAYNAGYIISEKYVVPVDTEKAAKTRGKTAQDMYNIMTK